MIHEIVNTALAVPGRTPFCPVTTDILQNTLIKHTTIPT